MKTRKIQHGDNWYVLATLAHTELQPQVLKSGETFAIFDRFGDIAALAAADEGLFHNDTRHLSHMELLVDGLRPLQLGAGTEHANSVLGIDLMNPDIAVDHEVQLAKGTLHMHRTKLLRQGACQERLTVGNFGADTAEVRLGLTFAADFIDLFEMRGMRRERRGDMLAPAVAGNTVTLSYRGLDAVIRRTHLRFDPPPQELSEQFAVFDISVAPGEHRDLEITVTCECEGEPAPKEATFAQALDTGRREWQRQHEEGLFNNDTRHLSHMELLVDGLRPLQLGAGTEHANSVLGIDLMNPDIAVDHQVELAKGTLHMHRTKLLRQGACQERLTVGNFGADTAEVRLGLTFAADFIDLFEMRGMRRERRGDMLAPTVAGNTVTLSYRGLDAVIRRTHLRFDPPPNELNEQFACFDICVAPGEHRDLEITVTCE
ncbi:MAG TPA: glycogen debranching N-terminal domain-containing protein, partial [Ramlibacter sp.]|nr:glycogen debranching N-terminal domain-containing protein [Ramlibacter sp.]